jgi:hypothetical protein
MEGLGLLVGHLLGDYILQNDWMAANKTGPGPEPNIDNPLRFLTTEHREWCERWEISFYACTIHCLLYTLAVWACSFWWMPWWGLAVCFAAHWPIDRFRLARLWMVHVSGQKDFATGPLAPWSVIVVDNTLHLLTLYAIGLLAGC